MFGRESLPRLFLFFSEIMRTIIERNVRTMAPIMYASHFLKKIMLVITRMTGISIATKSFMGLDVLGV